MTALVGGDVRGILEFLASGRALRPTHAHSVDTVGVSPGLRRLMRDAKHSMPFTASLPCSVGSFERFSLYRVELNDW